MSVSHGVDWPGLELEFLHTTVHAAWLLSLTSLWKLTVLWVQNRQPNPRPPIAHRRKVDPKANNSVHIISCVLAIHLLWHLLFHFSIGIIFFAVTKYLIRNETNIRVEFLCLLCWLFFMFIYLLPFRIIRVQLIMSGWQDIMGLPLHLWLESRQQRMDLTPVDHFLQQGSIF